MNPKSRIRKKYGYLKRWMPDDKEKLFQLILQDPEKFEVPTAQIYYRNIIQNFPEFTDYGWISMRDKLRNSRLKYMKAIDWKRNLSDGLEDDPRKSREYMLKICPDFDSLDIIFGSRKNIKRESIDHDDYDHEISNQRIETNSMAFLAEAELSNKIIDNLDNLDKKQTMDMDFNLTKLQLERDKLELEKEKMRREFQLKETELQNNFQIQKLKLLQEKELKLVELKLKYKDTSE